MADPFRVTLGITGSIAAYKCADLVRKLRALRDPQAPDRRVEVRAILTKNGAEFITPTVLQTLTGNPVYQELFVPAGEWDVEHVGLADDADLLLIAPATANILAKLATGLADDLLSSTALACTAPLLIAPAMNVHMWEHPATQENISLLLARGAEFVGPEAGELACGYSGRGRLATLEAILAAVERHFLAPAAASCDFAGRRVVITAGPTREYLDPVRFLTNPSTGKMGYALARAAARRGATVTLVSGPVELPPPPGVTVAPVVSAAEMAEATLAAWESADVLIGAAAPADFTPAAPAAQKLKKAGRDGLEVALVPTVDILAAAGARKRPGQVIVAFAAETERLEEYAVAKLARKNADLIVANDVTAPGAGFAADTNRAVLLYASGRRDELPLQSKDAMAGRILDAVAELLSS
jgi:phosphopantothenoylcysteine decarboxylase/phosphopantothenate--cysteine ligase